MKKITDIREYLSKITDGEKVYAFLNSVDESKLGRHDFNSNLYVNVISFDSSVGFDGVFETHRDYIDVHVLIEGKEKIFYCNKEKTFVVKHYDKDGDCEFVKGDDYSFITYQKMQGVEFLVGEPHMASIAVNEPEKVVKAIIKIAN